MSYLSIRIHRIFCAAWRRRYIIIIPIILLPIFGLIVAMSSIKHYQSHTSMLIQETAKMNPFLEDLAVSSMLKERMGALQTLLNSRHILSSVARDLNIVNETTSNEERDRIIAKLSGNLRMDMVGKDLIRINLTSEKSEGMKEILTSVSNHFIEQLLAPERSSIKDSAYFLKETLSERSEELDGAEQALAMFKVKYADMLPEYNVMNFSRLNQLKQKLSERETEYAGAIKSVNGLNQLLSRTNPVVGYIEEQIIKIRSELALLKSRYTDKHSKVQALLRALRSMESERQRALNDSEQIVNADQLWDMASSTIKSGNEKQPILISQLENLQTAKNRADSLREEISRLKNMVANIEKGISDFGEHENELNGLQRDLKVKRELYEELLLRYEMAKVTGSLGEFEQGKRVKIIDQPFTPSSPANLPGFLFVIAGFFGGLALGIGLALMIEITDSTIRSRSILEDISGVPVISRIPPLVN